MPITSALRFRILLDLAKQIIFAVDKIPFQLQLLMRKTGHPRIVVPEIGQAVDIPAGTGHIAGWFVTPGRPMEAVVLLFHGIGDRIAYWRRAQHRLAESGVGSLVFHYSGYPGSSGSTTPENLDADAHAAYAWLLSHVPPGTPIFLLGFSLGSGLAAHIAAHINPPPAGLILCEAFTSLRDAARRITRPFSFLGNLLPDVWQTRENVCHIELPILVVHSTGDALFPVSMAQAIHSAAQSSGRQVDLEILTGHAHNAPYLNVPEDYWAAILRFIMRHRNTRHDTTPRPR